MDRVQVSSKKVCKSARDSDKKRKKRKSTRSSSTERRTQSSQKRKKICDTKIRGKDLDRKRVKRSRKHSSSSGSDTSSSSSSTSTSSSSMSSSSSSASPKNRKKKSKEKIHRKKRSKLKKQKKMKAKRKEKLRAVLTNTEKLISQHAPPPPPPPPKIQIQKPVQTVDEGLIGPDPKLLRAKSMAPMTKQEWEAKQSIIRRVYDEQTGRDRIIKGDGEVLEEIVSLQRHKDINKKATETDGAYFLYSNRNLK